MPDSIDRRRFVRNALALGATLPAASMLTGCAGFFQRVAESCPGDPDESGGIDWTPHVLHPVFHGFQDLATPGGAPGPVRVWYPSHDGAADNAPILKLCVVRWPVVLFLHGQPPSGGAGCSIPDYHQRWDAIPRTLARSGYVVVVPGYEASIPQAELPPTAWELTLLDWVRSDWEHARWVDRRPEATAVAGHSYGALRAARVAHARPQISSFVGLGGGWTDFGADAPDVLRAIGAPSFFMHTLLGLETLDSALWRAVRSPKIAAAYPGAHFDYIREIPGCSVSRGSCARIEDAAADLVALFIARYTPVPLSRPRIPVSLDPAPVRQTDRQRFVSGGHLTGDGRLAGLSRFADDVSCRIDLRWEDDGGTGSRTIGA